MATQHLESVRNTQAENTGIVRRGYAAFDAVDLEMLTKLFDESSLVTHARARHSRRRP